MLADYIIRNQLDHPDDIKTFQDLRTFEKNDIS
jgi:hypothetical protein